MGKRNQGSGQAAPEGDNQEDELTPEQAWGEARELHSLLCSLEPFNYAAALELERFTGEAAGDAKTFGWLTSKANATYLLWQGFANKWPATLPMPGERSVLAERMFDARSTAAATLETLRAFLQHPRMTDIWKIVFLGLERAYGTLPPFATSWASEDEVGEQILSDVAEQTAAGRGERN